MSLCDGNCQLQRLFILVGKSTKKTAHWTRFFFQRPLCARDNMYTALSTRLWPYFKGPAILDWVLICDLISQSDPYWIEYSSLTLILRVTYTGLCTHLQPLLGQASTQPWPVFTDWPTGGRVLVQPVRQCVGSDNVLGYLHCENTHYTQGS